MPTTYAHTTTKYAHATKHTHTHTVTHHMHTSTDSNDKNAKTTLRPIAEKYFSDCKQQGREAELCFFYCSKEEDAGEDDEEIVTSLRNFAKLPERLPLLSIIDIPGQKVYVSDKTTIDAGVVEEFVRSYEAKTLSGKPLHG